LVLLTLLEALMSSTPIGISKPTEDQSRKAWSLSCSESLGVSCKINPGVAVSNTTQLLLSVRYSDSGKVEQSEEKFGGSFSFQE